MTLMHKHLQYHHGINLGGWLAQYDFTEGAPLDGRPQLERHFDTFITEEDIERIHSWGFDHVRIPLDGRTLSDEDAVWDEAALQAVHRALRWCGSRQMGVILDLHDFPGNEYGQMSHPIPMLTDPNLTARFVHAWRSLAILLRDWPGRAIMFELFNEISDSTGYLWNDLCAQAARPIREIDDDRLILIGSNHQNSVNYLTQLNLMDDPNIVYNFHYYDPQVFTHQKAHFSEEMRDFNRTITYPGDISAFADYLAAHPQWRSKHELTAHETRNDRALMERLLADAHKFVQYSGHDLYCGEYGVIDTAPAAEAVKWLEDFWRISDATGFGRALWNYKTLDFGLVNLHGEIVHPEIVDALVHYGNPA